jgi:hypothetical protein
MGALAAVALVLSIAAAFRRRVPRVGDGGPAEVSEPPSNLDVVTVGLLVDDERPPARVVGAMLVQFAEAGLLSFEQYGERLLLRKERSIQDPKPLEQMVLGDLALRLQADGTLEAPLWPEEVGWWRSFRKQARDDG